MKDELSILTLGAAKSAGGGGGGGGTTNYNSLENKPQINGTTLSGNKTGEALGLASTSDIPKKTSDLTNDSNFVADASYVHTDYNYDSTAKAIVDGVTSALAGKADTSDIPTKISDLTNDSDFIETSSTAGLMKNDGTVDTTSYATAASVSAITDGQSIDSFSDVESALADKANTSDLTSYVQKSQTAGLLKNDGTVDTNTYAQASQLPSVATSSAVGLVKPDGSTTTVDANGVITAVGGSSGVSDVSWDSTNKKLKQTKNGTTSDIVTGATILNGLTSSQVTNALGYTPPQQDTNTHRPIQVNDVEVLGNNVTALNLKAGTNVSLSNSGGEVTISASGDTIIKTRYSVSYSMWSSSPNADGYYTRTITLNPTINTDVAPNVYLTGSGSTPHPDDTMKQMYSYVERCYLSGSTLTLYAKTKPTATFYIYVEGVAGSGSGSIVGNVIQPNGAVSGGGIDFGSPFVNKKFSYADLQSGSGTATKELSSTEISALLACNSVLIVLRQNDENDNSVDQQAGTTILLTNRIKTPIADVISFINYEHNSTTATPLPVQGFYRYNHNYGTNSTHVLTFRASQAYMDDQWSSGKWWYITMYKLS